MTAITRRPTTPAAPDDDWMHYGLCAQTDPDLFFPEGLGKAITVQTEQAKQVCSRCPVRSACLDWALDTGQSSGVWGGMSENDLRQIRRQRAAERKSNYAKCIDHQQYIERRVSEEASHRTIAEELGVSRTAVDRACQLFASERRLNQDEQVMAA